MDKSEALAKEYLLACGFRDIVHEPDGKVPPDFVVNKNIGVEVRRLNQNYESQGRARGLEEDAQPLCDGLRAVLASFGPLPRGENWYVSFSFRRPYGSRREIWRRARAALQAFMTDSERSNQHWQLTPGFWLETMKAGTRRANAFTIGGYVDHDDGGWVLHELQRNFKICVGKKTAQRKNAKRAYSEWWLIFVDHISYGLPDEEDRKQLMSLISPAPDWHRIILLNPLDTKMAMVLQDKSSTIVAA